MYQDMGASVFYDQCQTYASQYGANIITPQTIGLTGENYWIATACACMLVSHSLSLALNSNYYLDNLFVNFRKEKI